jgi:hypothetical protein
MNMAGAPDDLPSGSPAPIADPAAGLPGAAPGKTLSAAAIRALAEAAERRREAPAAALPPEIDGRGGEEPTRFGDWEKKGIAVDF